MKLVDADALVVAIKTWLTVDAVPVVHARWMERVPGEAEMYCSHCKRSQPWYPTYGAINTAYCPCCGARMDLEEE